MQNDRIRNLVNEMIETELRRIETHPGFIRISTDPNMEQSIRGYTGNMYDNINNFLVIIKFKKQYKL